MSLVVTEHTTRAALAEAIGHLRLRQLAVMLDSTRAELQVEIDALLDRYVGAP